MRASSLLRRAPWRSDTSVSARDWMTCVPSWQAISSPHSWTSSDARIAMLDPRPFQWPMTYNP